MTPSIYHKAYHIESRIANYLTHSRLLLAASCCSLPAALHHISPSTRVSTSPYVSQTRNMNTSMVKSKFLSHPGDLGIVAVGFAGGQV